MVACAKTSTVIIWFFLEKQVIFLIALKGVSIWIVEGGLEGLQYILDLL